MAVRAAVNGGASPFKDAVIAEIKAPEKHKAKYSERVVITPEIAEAWLDKNVLNRRIKIAHVKRLANDMKAGKWYETDDPIRFDTNGNLIDGQHRLHAIIASDTPVTATVIYGYSPEAQAYIDSGAQRTPGDIFALKGYSNGPALSSALRVMYLDAKGYALNFNSKICSRQMLISLLEAHPSFEKYIIPANHLPKGVLVPAVSYLRFLAHEHLGMAKEIEEAIKVLKTGVPTYEDDAMHAFRERIISGSAFAGLGASAARAEQWRLLQHAFVLFAEKRPVKILRSPANVSLWDFDPTTLLDGVDLGEDEGIETHQIRKQVSGSHATSG